MFDNLDDVVIHAKPGKRQNLFSRDLIDAALMLPNVLARYGVAGLFGIAHAILQLNVFIYTPMACYWLIWISHGKLADGFIQTSFDMLSLYFFILDSDISCIT